MEGATTGTWTGSARGTAEGGSGGGGVECVGEAMGWEKTEENIVGVGWVGLGIGGGVG